MTEPKTPDHLKRWLDTDDITCDGTARPGNRFVETPDAPSAIVRTKEGKIVYPPGLQAESSEEKN